MLYVPNDNKHIPLQYLLMRLQRNVDNLKKMAAQMGAEASKMMKDMPSQSMRMALVVMVVIPIAFAYPFFQRYIIAGLTVGSVKG